MTIIDWFRISMLIVLLGFTASCSGEDTQGDYDEVDTEVIHNNKRFQVKGISQEDFVKNQGKVITIEGVAVNSKPFCFINVGYFVYIPTDQVFFWNPYLEGKKVSIKGVPVVLNKRDRRYAQIKDIKTRYFFETHEIMGEVEDGVEINQ